ncbi:hypothetical protein ACR6C2_00875 [Streptomyces sp. INA 01156]
MAIFSSLMPAHRRDRNNDTSRRDDFSGMVTGTTTGTTTATVTGTGTATVTGTGTATATSDHTTEAERTVD